jgi:DNA-binding NarL/FixJ family response regulator
MSSTLEEMIANPMFVKLPPMGKLTRRQMEVFTLIACGKGIKEVAVDLNISVKTAETHLAMIYKALKIHKRAELTLLAIRENFVKVV